MNRSHITRAALAAALVFAPAAAAPRPSPGLAERIEYRDPATAPARGPLSALVTIEVFFVPGVNTPNTALRLLQQLQDQHPARIRLVYRILKGSMVLIVPSVLLEAHVEDKFFELLDELSKQRGQMKKDELLELARKVGVDSRRVALATQFEQFRDVLEANQRRLERLRAGSLPAVLFNGKATRTALGTITPADLEREYNDAYERALEKIERGFAPAQLAQAFDEDAMWAGRPGPLAAATREGDDDGTLDHPLATPPLVLDGLPSVGKPGVPGAVPVAVLCRPNDAACTNLLRIVESEVRLYPDDVRVVWAPWFEVASNDAADLTLLGDAALCAEAIGSNHGELTTSPGWVWVKEMHAQSSRSHGRKLDPEVLIDAVADKLRVDDRVLSACRARMASTTLDWIAAARRSGVPTRATSAIVIGGRIYDGLTDQAVIQELVETELAPGVLGSLPRWHTSK
jgi:hypothetical protein